MRTQVLVLLMMGLVALVCAGVGGGRTMDPVPGFACSVKNPVDPPEIFTLRGETLIGGAFRAQCKIAVAEMGVYACLEELDHPFAPPRIVECFANSDRPVLIAPHETSVYMAAVCDYTTKHRWYQISGHAWVRRLPTSKVPIPVTERTQTIWSPRAVSFTTGSKGVVKYCHIGREDLDWRTYAWIRR